MDVDESIERYPRTGTWQPTYVQIRVTESWFWVRVSTLDRTVDAEGHHYEASETRSYLEAFLHVFWSLDLASDVDVSLSSREIYDIFRPDENGQSLVRTWESQDWDDGHGKKIEHFEMWRELVELMSVHSFTSRREDWGWTDLFAFADDVANGP